MKRLAVIVLAVLLPQMLLAQDGFVTFSQGGGFYEEAFMLSLQCDGGFQIRYTTNGSTPTASSALYVSPLLLNEDLYSNSMAYTIVNTIPSQFYEVENVEYAIVIRAAAFDENGSCVTPVVTNTYLIKALGCNTHGLPVLSIAADSLDLFDYERGIFVPGIYYDPADSTHTGNFQQTGREWERGINVEFYETDNTGINQRCGLRTHGGASRWFQQKGMKLYAREEYGKKRFTHAFFENSSIANVKHLNLHPFRCSHWLQTGGQDYLSHRVASNMNIDGLGVRQTVVFINGEYWGVYTLEESPDERYLEDHYEVDLEQVNIIKYWGVISYGDGMDWWRFRNWIENADLNQPDDSAYAFSRMDVPSFVDYLLLETYGANLDWPANNVLQWQASNGEPFRMIFFDGDGCFTRWYYPALERAMHADGCSLIINKFLESSSFLRMLRNRYMELSSSTLGYNSLSQFLMDYRLQVEDEVPQQSERFGFPRSMQRWQSDMDSTDAFFNKRIRCFEEELYSVLSVETNEVELLGCYPNPSCGAFRIVFSSDIGATIPLAIYDLAGRKVFAEKRLVVQGLNSFMINTDLPPGLYMLRFGAIMRRIVIE